MSKKLGFVLSGIMLQWLLVLHLLLTIWTVVS